MKPIQRFVVGWSIPDDMIARLRSGFPGVQFVQAYDAELVGALPGADAAIAWSLSPEEWSAASELRWFQSIGAGVERTILPGMRERGLILTNTSGIHATNIAEHVLAMMLAFARQLQVYIRNQEHRVWQEPYSMDGVFEIDGQSLLVVGYGEIGASLARRASALGMHVSAVRRSRTSDLPPDLEMIGSMADLPRMLGSADHVAICLPQTPETIGLFDGEMLAAMKPGAFLYNIGRGPIIDTQALIAALESGHLGGAGLDVVEPEPLPEDSPLWARTDVIISAHNAGRTPFFWTRIEAILTENIRRFNAGEPLVNVVSYDLGY